MKCERAQEWFSSLVDGSIQPAEKVVLEAHLHACRDCADEVRRLKSMWQALDAMPQLAPPSNLRATIWQRIETANAPAPAHGEPAPRLVVRSPRSRLLRGFAFAAAAMLIAALATVSVPGKYRAASLYAMLTKPFAPSARDAAFEADVQTGSDGAPLVHLRGTFRTSAIGDPRVGVEIILGDTAVATHEAEVRTGRVDVTIPITGAADHPYVLRLRWRDSAGVSHTQTIQVRPK